MYCLCGAKLDQFTGDRLYSTTTMNQYGEIVYAVCSHGKVIIDKTKTPNTDFTPTQPSASQVKS